MISLRGKVQVWMDLQKLKNQHKQIKCQIASILYEGQSC